MTLENFTYKTNNQENAKYGRQLAQAGEHADNESSFLDINKMITDVVNFKKDVPME